MTNKLEGTANLSVSRKVLSALGKAASDVSYYGPYYAEEYVTKPLVKIGLAAMLSALPLGIGVIGYAGYQEFTENEHLKALADGLVRGDLELSIEVKPGQAISLNHPKPEDKALIEFLSTTGRSESVIKGQKNSQEEVTYDKEIIKLNVATPSGAQLCSIPVEGKKFKQLLQGEIPAETLERSRMNLDTLGEICGFTKEKIEQMKANTKIGVLSPAVEPNAPYSVISPEGRVAMGQRVVAPSEKKIG